MADKLENIYIFDTVLYRYHHLFYDEDKQYWAHTCPWKNNTDVEWKKERARGIDKEIITAKQMLNEMVKPRDWNCHLTFDT